MKNDTDKNTKIVRNDTDKHVRIHNEKDIDIIGHLEDINEKNFSAYVKKLIRKEINNKTIESRLESIEKKIDSLLMK